jgi:hypothetical protein
LPALTTSQSLHACRNKNAINLLNPHRAPGHDLIVTTILKNLSRKLILTITYIYRTAYFAFVIFLFSGSSLRSLYPNRENPRQK